MVFTSRTVPWDKAPHSRELLLSREWLVTNGLGGFASGTIAGAVTRRYHGLLIAALPTPHGRTVMWSHVSEFLRFHDDDVVSLGAEERAGGQLDLGAADYLHEFRLENGLPVWTYCVRGVVLEKRVLMLHLQNTVHVIYRILEAETRPRLELRPAFYFRHYESAVNEGLPAPYHLSAIEDRYEVSAPQSELPPLRMKLANDEAQFTVSPQSIHQVFYRVEQSRGYSYEGELWSPGFFVVD
ncbi:MAG TPA: glycogen debranching enzyme N-terminal domain-containing protein, partial [Chthoniobacterales bacterium]|nr:glycogen debranching enzyme N-terminal domain-containing protein [Chthoniobacterales bacterium]